MRPVVARMLIVGMMGLAGISASVLAAAPAEAGTYLSDQWGLGVIGAPSAWQYGTGTGVRIGIVDTGVDSVQEDLVGKIVAQQYFVSNPSGQCAQSAPAQNVGADDNGHGTHVSGIAAASGAVGVSGVAPSASLVVAKVLDCQGSGRSQDVVNGINWAVANGARVINLSLGDAPIAGIDTSQIEASPLGEALQNAWNAGAIPVVAGGNNGGGPLGLGNANYAGVPAVIVAATGSPTNGETDKLACYSNQINQAEWGVAAPGGDDPNSCSLVGPPTPSCGQYDPYEILSTYWWGPPNDRAPYNATNCYASDEGTSMATPFVSGALALLLGRGLSPTQAIETLLGTANHGVACGSVCSGLINVATAMQAVATTPHQGGGNAAPAPGPVTHASASGPLAHSASTSTSAAPTSTSAAPTTSTSTARRAAALGLHGRTSAAAHGSAWWLVLPIVLGLAAASALGVAGRRRLAVRRAEVHGLEPPDPPGLSPQV
jgi:subtilisin family serine protease